MDSNTGYGTGVDLNDVRFIDIARKSQIASGILIGCIPGMCIGYALGGPYEDIDLWEATLFSSDFQIALAIAAGGVVGGLIGGMIGGFAFSIDKRFNLEGMTEVQVQSVLKILRTKARVPDYK
jgi:hypothetical protein